MIRKLVATKERLESMSARVAASIAEDVDALGDNLMYQEEQLKIPRGFQTSQSVATSVVALMHQLISGALSALDARFSTFETDEVLKASTVFSPSTWPSDRAVLAEFGYGEIRLLSHHFSCTLQHRGYEPCADEWPELKSRVVDVDTLSLEPSLQYLDMWQKILNDSQLQPSLKNVLALVKIILLIPVQTATIERGLSLMLRVKHDWRSRLTPSTLSQLMMIKLNGPSIQVTGYRSPTRGRVH